MTKTAKPGEFAGVAKGPMRLLDAVPLALIEPETGFNPRQHMDEQELEDLAGSLVQHGMLQPVLLRPKPGVKAGDGFYLTGGHRRYEAAKLANLKTIPAILRGTGDALVAAVLDNSHRVELTPLEEALVYRRAMTEKGLTERGVAEILSVALKRVTERLRILVLPENAQQAIGDGKIGTSHVGWMADIAEKSPVLCAAIAEYMIDTGRVPDSFAISRHVIPKTKGLIDPHSIKAGSKAFKLSRPEVKDAVDELASIDNKYSGPEYQWRHSPEARDHLRIGHGDIVGGSSAFLEEGVKVGAVVKVQTPSDRGDQGAYAVIDAKWLQQTLEERALAAAKSLDTYVKRHKTAAKRTADRNLSPVEQAQKTREKAERERKARQREAAIEANKRLGKLLMDRFAAVELTVDVIRALCVVPMHEASQFGAPNRDDVAGLAAGGMRYLALPEFAATRQVRGKTVPCLMTDRKQLAEAFWAWWRKAKTANEIAGRTLIALLAAHYADRAQCMSNEVIYNGSFSLNSEARAALEKLLPPKQVEKAGALTKLARQDKLITLDDVEEATHCMICGQEFEPGDEVGEYTNQAGQTLPGHAECIEEPADEPAEAEATEATAEVTVGRDSGQPVKVRKTKEVDDGQLLDAILLPDVNSGNRNVVKVKYVHSKTAAWIAKDRIVTESEGEAPAGSDLELTEAERKVFVELYQHADWYELDTETQVNQKVCVACELGTQKAAKQALAGLREKRLIGGSKKAPWINQAYKELAKALALAKASREGGDDEVNAELERQKAVA